MSYETLIVETTDGVTLIRLNRPEALNARNSQLLASSAPPSTPPRPTKPSAAWC